MGTMMGDEEMGTRYRLIVISHYRTCINVMDENLCVIVTHRKKFPRYTISR